jgi:hypothetical protein
MGSKVIKAENTAAGSRAVSTLPLEADERHQDQVDDFIARNRDELAASVVRSREELARGASTSRTVDQIIADGRRRHGADS